MRVKKWKFELDSRHRHTIEREENVLGKNLILLAQRHLQQDWSD